MLQGVEAERRDGGGVGMSIDAEDAAFLTQGVAFEVQVDCLGLDLPRLGPCRHVLFPGSANLSGPPEPYVGGLAPNRQCPSVPPPMWRAQHLTRAAAAAGPDAERAFPRAPLRAAPRRAHSRWADWLSG